MPGGWFEIIIRDVTKGLDKRLNEIRADIKIFNSEVEAEIAANQAAAGKQKKK
jgi:hypothetical protein